MQLSTSAPFKLKYQIGESTTSLNLILPQHLSHTHHVTETHSFLAQHCPEVLNTTCFNDLNLPFAEEVKKTEMGHLFEHILLTHLCAEKQLQSSNHEAITYCGETFWNWHLEEKGTFTITIRISADEADIFQRALTKTCLIFQRFLELCDQKIDN